MATTNSIIDRTGASALMPEQYSTKFLEDLQGTSAVLSGFTNVPVSRAQVRFPILGALPVAYFVNGDTGLKQTSQISWKNKYLNIEEIAVIVPVPDNVVSDSQEPIWDQVSPLLVKAAGRLLDSAVFFGTEAPASWPEYIVKAAEAAGNYADVGDEEAKVGGIVADQGNVLEKVESGGYDPRVGVAARSLRGLARGARNTLGDRFGEVKINADSVEIDGITYTFPMRGLWPTASEKAKAIMWDPEEFVVGVRSDVSWVLSNEAVITDSNGAVVYNLFQQDMHALRLTMRVGWQVANTIKYDQEDETKRYPAGVLQNA